MKLSEMICGNEAFNHFLYRSSSQLTIFFWFCKESGSALICQAASRKNYRRFKFKLCPGVVVHVLLCFLFTLVLGPKELLFNRAQYKPVNETYMISNLKSQISNPF